MGWAGICWDSIVEEYKRERGADPTDAFLRAAASAVAGDHGAVPGRVRRRRDFDGPRAPLYGLLGAMAYRLEERQQQALDWITRPIQIHGGFHASWRLRGDILADTGGDEGAAEAYGRASMLGAAEERAEALGELSAVMGERLGMHAGALEAADRGLGLAPGDRRLLQRRAAALSGLGRHAGAAEAAAAGLGTNPGHIGLNREAAHALGMLGRHVEAMVCADRLILAVPHEPGIWYVKARLLALMGRDEEALDALTVAVALDAGAQELMGKDGAFDRASGTERPAGPSRRPRPRGRAPTRRSSGPRATGGRARLSRRACGTSRRPSRCQSRRRPSRALRTTGSARRPP